MPGSEHAPKLCASCGRRFEWRRSLARNWEQARYCSRACRSRRVNALDRTLERSIVDLLHARDAGGSICPSEAARHVARCTDHAPDWRTLMEPCRRAARRLAHRGEVLITQRGRVVDAADFRGPIRIRRTP